MDESMETPEGALINRTLRAIRPPISGRAAAQKAELSEGRWRQIVTGYASMGQGRRAPVVAPALTLAKMAKAVGVTPDELVEVGREDAAEELLRMEDGILEALEQVQSRGRGLAEESRIYFEAKDEKLRKQGRDVWLGKATEDQLLLELRRRVVMLKLRDPEERSRIEAELEAAREAGVDATVHQMPARAESFDSFWAAAKEMDLDGPDRAGEDFTDQA